MTWEETIKFIRTKPEFSALVRDAYFEENLVSNVERFKKGVEYKKTRQLLSKYIHLSPSSKLLDIGSGNGISAVAFALDGIQVDSVEPDPSETIGAGAIRKLKQHYGLSNLQVHEGFAEQLNFPASNFDIIYVRQCLHHAHDLNGFVRECGRVLKIGGILITVRDHVAESEAEKQKFFKLHPLQKFYGGENAFSLFEYKNAFKKAGLQIEESLGHYESAINYFPLTETDLEKAQFEHDAFIESIVKNKLGSLVKIRILNRIASKLVERKLGKANDPAKIPGRLHTFIAVKK